MIMFPQHYWYYVEYCIMWNVFLHMSSYTYHCYCISFYTWSR